MSSSPGPAVGEPEPGAGAASERDEVWREATTMALYVSMVLLAELAALPAGHEDDGGPLRGPVGGELLVIVWGTTIGLAVAHWFAFRLAARGFAGGTLRRQDHEIAVAQVAAAGAVAALTSLPVLLFSAELEQQVAPYVPALVIGGVGYVLARGAGRSVPESLLRGGIALGVGLVGATVKYVLSSH